MQKIFLFFFFLCNFLLSFGAIVISGIPNTIGAPFPFTVRATAYDRRLINYRSVDRLFIGANEPIVNDAYKAEAISTVAGTQLAVTGITPQTIIINHVPDQQNPLYGAQISFLALSDGDPFVVATALSQQVFFLKGWMTQRPVLFQSPILTNDIPQAIGAIIGLAALPGRDVAIPEVDKATGLKNNERLIHYSNKFYAAVTPMGGTFGDPHSGIVQGILNAVRNNQGMFDYILQQENFFSLDRTSNVIAINSSLTAMSLGAIIASNYPKRISAVYTGLVVTGGPGATDGAISVTINGDSPIVPSAAIQTNSIIGGIGANVQVSAYFLDTLLTSTQLDYLVVVGGVGSPLVTQQTVYALPLTQSGLLAAKTAVPETVYITTPNVTTHYFANRYFPDTQAAAVAGDLYSPSSSDVYQVQVGGTVTLPGPITALFTEKDTVFVAVDSNSADDLGGLFYSQALLNATGAIMGWTDWRRAENIVTPLFFMAFDANESLSWFLAGTDPDALTTLQKVQWYSGGISSFDKTIQQSFSNSVGSQGLFDFSRFNPAFNQTVGSRFSMMVATGDQHVLLLQSGADVGTLFTPVDTITQMFNSSTGSLNGFVPPVEAIDVVGGNVLSSIGPIIAADIVSDGIYSWLLIGGSYGIAVLANPDGSGWPEGTLTSGFAGLPATLSFKLVMPLQQVRKIIADGANVYILTSNNIYRFTASQTSFASPNNIALTMLASNLDLVGTSGTFADMQVSGPLALLATSFGLFISGIGKDVSSVQNEAAVGWQYFPLPESPGPVTRLFPISPTAFATDFAKNSSGGNIYVLSGAVSAQQAAIYRLAIQGLPLTSGQVTASTVSLFQDQYVEGQLSTYLYVGDYRNYCATDGASLFLSRSAYYPKLQSSYMQVVSPDLRTSVYGLSLRGQYFMSPTLQTTASGMPIFVPSRIGPMIQRSTTGSWMLAGTDILVQA